MATKIVEHNKLVRNYLPIYLLEEKSVRAISHIATNEEFITALLKKIVEEANELKEARGDGVLQEIADLYEVLETFCLEIGFDEQTITNARTIKTRARGSFDQGVILETTEEEVGDEPQEKK